MVRERRAELLELMRSTPVVCVQAKNHRLGPRLLGQALFSRGLLETEGVTVERSIALCGGTDPDLEAIAREEFGLDVIVDPLVRDTPESSSLLRRDAEGVTRYWQAVGGTLYPKFPIRHSRAGAVTMVDALLVPGPKEARPTRGWVDLEGAAVTVVVSTRMRACMYSLGLGVFARALAERAGARAEAVVIARDHDAALAPLLAAHPGVSVVPASGVPRA